MMPPDEVREMLTDARAKTGRSRLIRRKRWLIPAIASEHVSWKASEEEGLWDCRFHTSAKGKILCVVRCGFVAGTRVCRLVEDRRGIEYTAVEED